MDISTTKKEIRIPRAPRGMADVLPEQMPLVRHIEDTARNVFERFGYSEIRPPLFEETALFVRGIGEATDIVEKEMYTFTDPVSGDSITLRPEATASVVRSFLEHNMGKTRSLQKLYYIGPMFRKEKPQAGRMREFYQLGVEVLGSYAPLTDAETILLAMQVFKELGLDGCKVKLNSIGCLRCRADYRQLLKERLKEELPHLCEDCRNRYERNVFRILDCKREQCKAVTGDLPPLSNYLDAECSAHFEAVKDALARQNLPFVVDDHLVRGFDYYTRTVYEICHSSLGARDAICGGGRYDNLVAEIGGPPTGAVGFAIGELPTLLALQARGAAEKVRRSSLAVYVVAIGEAARMEGFRVANTLRQEGISADFDPEGRSPKAQMRTANKLGASFVLVIGPDEMEKRELTLKNMTTGEEKRVPSDEVVQELRSRL